MLLGQAMWRLLLVLVVLRTASKVDGGRHTVWNETWIQLVYALQLSSTQVEIHAAVPTVSLLGGGGKMCMPQQLVFCLRFCCENCCSAMRPMAGVGMCCRSSASGYLGWCCWCSIMKSDRMRWRCSSAMCCRLPTSRQENSFHLYRILRDPSCIHQT